MESASRAEPAPVQPGGGSAAGDKGLKTGAIGYLSNLVIGVASTEVADPRILTGEVAGEASVMADE